MWFSRPGVGLGVVTGAISGLEVLDFDHAAVFLAWRESLRTHPELFAIYERIAAGYEEQTPGWGRHLPYFCEHVEGNKKLARRPVEGPQREKTLIETRGEGGQVVMAPSAGTVHPSGRSYRRIRGAFSTIAAITPEERALFLESARRFDEMPSSHLVVMSTKLPPPFSHRQRDFPQAELPGQRFNKVARWEDILCPQGWTPVERTSLDGALVTYWRRPGKSSGKSASTNYRGSDLLYVFSSSTPFEPEQGYSKFRAYTILYHNGDFSAASRTLAEKYRMR